MRALALGLLAIGASTASCAWIAYLYTKNPFVFIIAVALIIVWGFGIATLRGPEA